MDGKFSISEVSLEDPRIVQMNQIKNTAICCPPPASIRTISDSILYSRLSNEKSLIGMDRKDNRFLLKGDQIGESVTDRDHHQHGNDQKKNG